MLYAILCYDAEEVVGAWTQEQDDAGCYEVRPLRIFKPGSLAA